MFAVAVFYCRKSIIPVVGLILATEMAGRERKMPVDFWVKRLYFMVRETT